MSNKNVYLYYKEFCLGCLNYKKQIFLWLPNVDNIKKAKSKYLLGMEFFFLNEEKSEMFDRVPPHFDVFKTCCERDDIKTKAGILDSDDDFSKLFKISKLDFFNEDFVIKTNA